MPQWMLRTRIHANIDPHQETERVCNSQLVPALCLWMYTEEEGIQTVHVILHQCQKIVIFLSEHSAFVDQLTFQRHAEGVLKTCYLRWIRKWNDISGEQRDDSLHAWKSNFTPGYWLEFILLSHGSKIQGDASLDLTELEKADNWMNVAWHWPHRKEQQEALRGRCTGLCQRRKKNLSLSFS